MIYTKEIILDSLKSVKIVGTKEYSLERTFDCGQCFRIEKSKTVEGAFEGVAFGRFVRFIKDEDGDVVILGATIDEYESIWHTYLSLDLDWKKIEEDVCSRSGELRSAYEASAGIRILGQDRFEALVSFIISQCNNIPRIKGLVSSLCRTYGKAITTPEGDTVYTFPSPDDILARPLSTLTSMKVGYRDKYIYAAALAAKDGILDRISEAKTTEEASRIISGIEGVGKKVAACALLFGFRRLDAFPVDVWMKRAMARLFPDCSDYSVFGPYAGVAQQYLFYSERYLGAADNKPKKP